MEIVCFFLIAFFVVISVFNITMAIKRNKKYVIILNGILYSVLAVIFLLQYANEAVIKRDSEKYSIYGGGLFGTIYYEGTEDDYLLIKETAFLSPYTEIAVPRENLQVSFFTKIYKPVDNHSDFVCI